MYSRTHTSYIQAREQTMANTILYFSLTLLFLLLAFTLYKMKSRRRNLHPGPLGRPITGNLHLQKTLMHHNFQKLAQKYDPVFSLRFGSRLVVVVSSSFAIEDCFTKNDTILAKRPKVLMAKHVSYDYKTVLQAPYGDHWQNLRRIVTTEILSNHRLNMLVNVRKDEVMRLITKLSRESLRDFARVELKSMFQELTFNVMMRMVTGKRYYGDDVSNVEKASRFGKLLKELSSYYGTSNPGDFLPIWNLIDGGRFERKVIELAKRTNAFLQGFVDDHRRKMEWESMKTVV